MASITAPATTFTEIQNTTLEAFLQDPIGYGTYDYADPITLAEFSAAPRTHSDYVSIIA